ncbi:MAG: carbon-nitrogen hydrolase family protein [Gammaproteobacteria bacterium]|nr:MAG: carbon-nitrogen hydrolase family protein [Gammaproteobacteria bacterium]
MEFAAIQMTSGPEVVQNLQKAEKYIHDAANAGARLIALPENFALMPNNDQDRLEAAEDMGSGVIQSFLGEQAKQNNIWLIGGTIPIRTHDPEKVMAGCLVYDNHGSIQARYDKIHLFDVSLNEDETYRESDYILPGSDTVVYESPWGKIGLAVCYDLRFPEMFREMLTCGLDAVVIPSAFTAQTGRAHWRALLQARAIENQIYIIAPNQYGVHANGRETYGHTMIIDPWGEICCCMETGGGYIKSKIDLDHIVRVRQMLPCLPHRRIGS